MSLSQAYNSTAKKAEVKQLQLLIDDVEKESRSTFRSFVSNPILWVLLLPSGSYGSLFLLETLIR